MAAGNKVLESRELEAAAMVSSGRVAGGVAKRAREEEAVVADVGVSRSLVTLRLKGKM